jgi:hypothetical protein
MMPASTSHQRGAMSPPLADIAAPSANTPPED